MKEIQIIKEGDRRIGKTARCELGTGTIKAIIRHPDGYELFELQFVDKMPAGGFTREEIQIEGEDF